MNRTIEFALPRRCVVLSYESSMTPGEHVVQVILHADDVETGQPGTFSMTERFLHPPSNEDVSHLVVHMLAHEVQEQLKLDPHNLRAPEEPRLEYVVRLPGKFAPGDRVRSTPEFDPPVTGTVRKVFEHGGVIIHADDGPHQGKDWQWSAYSLVKIEDPK